MVVPAANLRKDYSQNLGISRRDSGIPDDTTLRSSRSICDYGLRPWMMFSMRPCTRAAESACVKM